MEAEAKSKVLDEEPDADGEQDAGGEIPPIFLVVSGDQTEIFLGYSHEEEAEEPKETKETKEPKETKETKEPKDKPKAQTLNVITNYNLRKDTMKLLMDTVKSKLDMKEIPTMFIAFSDNDVMYGVLRETAEIFFCKLEIKEIIEYFNKLLKKSEKTDLASLQDKMKAVLEELKKLGPPHI